MPGAMSISTTLRKAAQLQDKIEQLRGQLAALLVQAHAEVEHAPAVTPDLVSLFGRGTVLNGGRSPAKRKTASARALQRRSGHGGGPAYVAAAGGVNRPVRRRRRGVSPLKGKKRNASPSGPLAPAVVKILAAKGEPMHVRDILEGLRMANYQFTSSEPKKNLAARIYRLKGVRQVGEGLFAAA